FCLLSNLPQSQGLLCSPKRRKVGSASVSRDNHRSVRLTGATASRRHVEDRDRRGLAAPRQLPVGAALWTHTPRIGRRFADGNDRPRTERCFFSRLNTMLRFLVISSPLRVHDTSRHPPSW